MDRKWWGFQPQSGAGLPTRVENEMVGRFMLNAEIVVLEGQDTIIPVQVLCYCSELESAIVGEI